MCPLMLLRDCPFTFLRDTQAEHAVYCEPAWAAVCLQLPVWLTGQWVAAERGGNSMWIVLLWIWIVAVVCDDPEETTVTRRALKEQKATH